MSEARYPRTEAEKQARQLVEQMTTDEKITQLEFDSPAIPRLHVPAYSYSNEALHGIARGGTATMFPQPIGMAAMFDPELMQKIGHAVGIEGRARYNSAVAHNDRDTYKGLTFWSPNINIFRDPRWGRGHETYGEDPYLTAQNGVAYIKGMQGEGKYLTVAACAKHFAVHSGPEAIRSGFDSKVSLKDLNETYLPAFKAAVEKGHAEAVMGAYNAVNGTPSVVNAMLLHQKLRQEWGFKGHVVSDYAAEENVARSHHYTKSNAETMALAIKAGCDLCVGHIARYLHQALDEGLITVKELDVSLVRLFTTRFMLGMGAKDNPDDALPFTVIDSPKHHRLAREATDKTFVLLKNDGFLPLKPETLKRVAVIGPNADSHVALHGNYTGTASNDVTLLAGIKAELEPQIRVFYAQGSHLYKPSVEGLTLPGDRLSEALSAAENSDVVILCLGLDSTIEGEKGDAGNAYGSGDKPNLDLPAAQQKLLTAMIATKKPIVLVLSAGSALTLNGAEMADNVHAIIDTWYPGPQGGTALADMLVGKISPSGKLPVTFYEATADVPSFTDYALTNRTYRYIKQMPLYPFGYGLTYSQVLLQEAQVVKDDKQVNVKLTVTNTGKADVEEVAQIYTKAPSPDAPLNPRLSGFKRFAIASGQTLTLTVPVAASAFTVVGEDGQTRTVHGTYQVFAGFGQPDERTEQLLGQPAKRLELDY